MFEISLSVRSLWSEFASCSNTRLGSVVPVTETRFSQNRITSVPDSAQALVELDLRWFSANWTFAPEMQLIETAQAVNTANTIIEIIRTAPL